MGKEVVLVYIMSPISHKIIDTLSIPVLGDTEAALEQAGEALGEWREDNLDEFYAEFYINSGGRLEVAK